MIFHKVTLNFPGESEVLFRKQYFDNSIIQFRVAFVLVILMYGSFGYLDNRIIPEFATLFLSIRYFVVIPLLLIVLILSFSSIFKEIWQLLLFICFVVSGTGISVMTILAPENYAYYAGMMLIFSAGYFFIKLRFLLASIAGWLTLLIFNAGTLIFTDASSTMFLSNNFFFVSANLIGMFAAYNIEYYTRRDFCLNYQLDHQKGIVENVNKNLETIVEERTKELIDAKNRAEESDRLKSAFLANMSHEIRTPMNGILGFSNLLKEPDLTTDQQKDYIEIIEQSGLRMLNIINDVVDSAKIESGLMNVKLLDVNLNEQIKYIYTFFKPEVENKGIQFSYQNSLPDENSYIKTDQEKLIAILTNLVKNAIKFTKEGSIEFGYYIKNKDEREKVNEDVSVVGNVNVNENVAENVAEHVLTDEHLELVFYVKDTGIGISLNKQAEIFERFIQADMSKTRASEGAGLGLYISKSYVEMLGGEIWVESQVGKGSTFYFTLTQ